MDGRMRTQTAAADGFPDDPLVEILSRLPAKPLFRFKCVSKGWRHLIAGRLGRRKFPQTLEGFFVGGGDGGGVNDWRFINLSGKSVPLVDASFSFLTKLPGNGIKQINLLSARNGLLLFEHSSGCGRYEYIVCNPATEQWVLVPGPGVGPHPPRKLMGCDCEHDLASEVNCFLIFDPSVSSHFHLLQFWHTGGDVSLLLHVHIFSSETGVWRDISIEWVKSVEFDEVRSKLGCADVSGMLHVPVHPQHLLKLSQTKDIQIAVVDMQGKKIMAIHWPGLNEFSAATFIGQSQGHLHCITAHKKQEGHLVHITGLSIWVLEDYDAAKCVLEGYDVGQWVLKQSVSCSQLFGEISCGVDDLDVIAIHPDRNLVFFIHHSNWKLMSYDMDTEEVRDLCTLGHGSELIIPYVPYFADVPVLSGRASTDFLEGKPIIV